MKYDFQRTLKALKDKGLPILERDLIILIDSALADAKAQAAEQPGDVVAGIVGMLFATGQSAIDAELAKILPDAAKA